MTPRCSATGGGSHSAEGGKSGPKAQCDVRFQHRQVILDGKEVVAAAFDAPAQRYSGPLEQFAQYR
jgi:hypothetical protein